MLPADGDKQVKNTISINDEKMRKSTREACETSKLLRSRQVAGFVEKLRLRIK